MMMGATPATLTNSGCTTPSAMPVATPASIALPPASRILKPASVARYCVDEIMWRVPMMVGRWAFMMSSVPLALGETDCGFDVAEDILVLRLEALPGAPFAANVDHRLVFPGIADDGHRLLAAFDAVHLLDEHLPIENDTFVARGEMLLRAVGDRPLADPARHVLGGNAVGDDLAVLVEQAGMLHRHRSGRGSRFAQGRAVGELDRMDVVNRDAELQRRGRRASDREDVREEQGMSGCPVVDVGRFTFEEAAFHDAVVEPVELDLDVPRRLHGRRAAELLELVVAECGVQELEVNRVCRVLHALQPAARQPVDLDDLVEVVTNKNVPARHEGRRLWTEVSENQSAELLRRICLDRDLVLVGVALDCAVLERLLDAAAFGVEQRSEEHTS